MPLDAVFRDHWGRVLATLTGILGDIELAEDFQPDFVSSSPFIPNEGTPLETIDEGDVDMTLNTMAIYRLLFPGALVPTVSALEKLRGGGQLAGLQAGANVITINFTPKDFREKYAIYSAKGRFIVSGGSGPMGVAADVAVPCRLSGGPARAGAGPPGQGPDEEGAEVRREELRRRGKAEGEV